jgi:tetratricopeptide (TPR) repeat protein
MKTGFVSFVAGALLCAALAFALWTQASPRSLPGVDPPAHDEALAAVEAELRAVRGRVHALEARSSELEAQFLALQRDAAESRRKDVERSVEPESEPLPAVATAAADAPDAAGGVDGAASSGEEIPDLDETLELLADRQTPGPERQKLWSRLAKAGLLDQALAFFDKRAEENAADPDCQVDLGHAYIQKLFTASDVEKGVLSMKAHGAYDKALALNDHHWDARFSKAVNYAFAPPIFGLQSKAIGEFETLISQQEAQAPEPRHAQTYLFLGNLYQGQGQVDRAKAAYERGLKLFPESKELGERVKAASGTP